VHKCSGCEDQSTSNKRKHFQKTTFVSVGTQTDFDTSYNPQFPSGMYLCLCTLILFSDHHSITDTSTIQLQPVVQYFCGQIQQELRKRLVWKERPSTGTHRIEMFCFVEVVQVLFPSLFNSNGTITLETSMSIEETFSGIASVHRDFLAHSTESCNNEFCRIHCDRVAVAPPMKVTFSIPTTLVFTFKLVRYRPNGEVY
jgi:hypothetical protein